MDSSHEELVLGGGCFWCIEAIFLETKGVLEVHPGYAGGTTPNPTYEEVCSGSTGHAEVVRVRFDPKLVSAQTLLNLFFHIHDPTTLNRQGNDEGTQYRSIVLYHSPLQKALAEQEKARAKELWGKAAVTELKEYKTFWIAEEYHWDYFRRNPGKGYCSFVIAPKVAKFRKEHPELIK